MCRAIYFALFSVALFGAISGAAIDNELTSNGEVVIIDDIESFMAQNPGVELLGKLKRSEDDLTNTLRYTYGKRVDGTISMIYVIPVNNFWFWVEGDRLVYSPSRNWTSTDPIAVGTRLTYPPKGESPDVILSHVDISVEQSSTNGSSWIARGGIGQRNITVIIEGIRTTVFNYVARFYGH